MEKKKKGSKLFDFLLVVVIIAVGFGYFAYNRSIGDVAPKVVINGVELSTDWTIQALLDEGFKLATLNGSIINVEKEGDIPAESYTSERYYIQAQNSIGNWEYTGVCVSVYNSSKNSKAFVDSKIYTYVYHASLEDRPCDVIINGVDFQGMTIEEAVVAFEEAGISFEEDEREEFLSGEFGILYGKPKNYKYILDADYEYEKIEFVEVKRKV